MFPTDSHLAAPTPGGGSDSTSATFHWLLILGFPPAVAAASLMPEIFIADDRASKNDATVRAFARRVA